MQKESSKPTAIQELAAHNAHFKCGYLVSALVSGFLYFGLQLRQHLAEMVPVLKWYMIIFLFIMVDLKAVQWSQLMLK